MVNVVAATVPVCGMGSPLARRSSRCSSMASRMSVKHSPCSSATATHPGSSGLHAPKVSVSPCSIMIVKVPIVNPDVAGLVGCLNVARGGPCENYGSVSVSLVSSQLIPD